MLVARTMPLVATEACDNTVSLGFQPLRALSAERVSQGTMGAVEKATLAGAGAGGCGWAPHPCAEAGRTAQTSGSRSAKRRRKQECIGSSLSGRRGNPDINANGKEMGEGEDGRLAARNLKHPAPSSRATFSVCLEPTTGPDGVQWARSRKGRREKAEKIRRKGGAGLRKFTGFSWRNKTGKRGLHKSGPARLRPYAPGETGDKISK